MTRIGGEDERSNIPEVGIEKQDRLIALRLTSAQDIDRAPKLLTFAVLHEPAVMPKDPLVLECKNSPPSTVKGKHGVLQTFASIFSREKSNVDFLMMGKE